MICSQCSDGLDCDSICYICADRNADDAKESGIEEGRGPIDSIEENSRSTPVRIVAKFRKSGEGFEDWPWLVNVNIGGWKRGQSVRCYGATMVEAIAEALELLAKDATRTHEPTRPNV